MRGTNNELLNRLPYGAATEIVARTGLGRTTVDRVLRTYPEKGNVKLENFLKVVNAAKEIIKEAKKAEKELEKELINQ
jgi:DNA-binding phage protein